MMEKDNLATVGFGKDKKKFFCMFIEWCLNEKGIKYDWYAVPMADCVFVYSDEDHEKGCLIGWYGLAITMNALYDTAWRVDEKLWSEYVMTDEYDKLITGLL